MAAALDIERVETDKSGGFVLELDGSRWVSVAYSTPEDKLMCQLCLEAILSRYRDLALPVTSKSVHCRI